LHVDGPAVAYSIRSICDQTVFDLEDNGSAKSVSRAGRVWAYTSADMAAITASAYPANVFDIDLLQNDIRAEAP
jgi:hypothetical protein